MPAPNDENKPLLTDCLARAFNPGGAEPGLPAGTLRVPCPRPAHLERLAGGVVPLFPELRRPLLTLSELAEPGCEHVIARHRVRSASLRTTFKRSSPAPR